MRRRDLLRQIGTRAAELGKTFEQIATSGRGSHEKWRVGVVQVAIPRHREINDLTAQQIIKATEAELGVDWWK